MDIVGYEGKYDVTKDGKIYTLGNRYIGYGKRELKQSLKRNGYLCVALSKDGKIKTCLAHRIIAQAFIPNPNNYPDVNHINGNKCDNRVENLEWCSKSYNSKHAVEHNLSGFRDSLFNNLKKD